MLDSATVAQVVVLINDGRSQRYVANFLNVPRTTVQRVYNRYVETGSYDRRLGSGRARCTTVQDEFIVVSALRNRHITSVEINANLQQMQVNVSDRTIQRRLAEENLHCRRPVLVPALKHRHREARLNFAIEHQNWNLHDWSRVLFTDESRFCLRVPDGRHRVYRRIGERFAPCAMKMTETFNGGSIMIWAGISADAHTDLHFFERTMNSHNYIEDIIIPYIVPYKEFIGDNFLLMQDNARPHVAQIVTDVLNKINIQRMVWPAMSPDMNPIEHLWDILKRRVKKHNAQTLAALRNALQEEWDNLDQKDISNLINSMPQRIQELLNVRGGNTRY